MRKFFENNFEWSGLGILVITTILRYLFAFYLPLTNDEAYYWDWSSRLQLSYIDHPPAVAWCALLGRFFGNHWYYARVAMPLVHLGTVFMVLGTARDLRFSKKELTRLICVLEGSPYFSLTGLLLLPDGVLLFGLSTSMFFLQRLIGRASLENQIHSLFGLAIGLSTCGLAKYHAAPVAIGMIGALFCFRRLSWSALILLIMAGFLFTMPVWIWNAQNSWASFQFQASHGTKQISGFHLDWGARILIAHFLFLLPWFAIAFWKWALVAWRAQSLMERCMFWSAVPLPLAMVALSFFKAILPHWTAPTSILGIHYARMSSRGMWLQLSIGALLSFGSIAPVAHPNMRDWVLSVLLKNEGGALSEITIWQPLVAQVQTLRLQVQTRTNIEDKACAALPVVTTRWMWTAQVAAYLKEQVFLWDKSRASYYTFRDDLSTLLPCPFLIISAKKDLPVHAHESGLNVLDSGIFIVNQHSSQPVYWVLAKIHDQIVFRNSTIPTSFQY